MPRCSGCGNQLTGAEQHCPACGQSTEVGTNLHGPALPQPPRALPLGNYIKIGWELFNNIPAGLSAFAWLTAYPPGLVRPAPGSWLVSAGLSAPLFMGNFIVTAKLLQRQTPSFREFFSGFYFFGRSFYSPWSFRHSSASG